MLKFIHQPQCARLTEKRDLDRIVISFTYWFGPGACVVLNAPFR